MARKASGNSSDFGDEDAALRDRCKIAFLAAKGKAATYDHAINLHVDLVFDRVKPRLMPLMIDPDVRYPGGSGQ